MVHCVAFGCTAKSDGGNKEFFLFPKDVVVRKKWVDAVGSCREVGGILTKWTPTKTSRLCKKHFVDSDFVRSPTVMLSIGLNLKLELRKTAVPSVFPDSINFKENRKPLALNPADLGPPKRKREKYETFQRRKHNHALAEILQEETDSMQSAVPACTDQVQDLSAEISATFHHYDPPTLVSRASQTDVVTVENKGFQCHPVTKEKCILALPNMSECGTGPDTEDKPVGKDKSYQFPERRQTSQTRKWRLMKMMSIMKIETGFQRNLTMRCHLRMNRRKFAEACFWDETQHRPSVNDEYSLSLASGSQYTVIIATLPAAVGSEISVDRCFDDKNKLKTLSLQPVLPFIEAQFSVQNLPVLRPGASSKTHNTCISLQIDQQL